MLGAGLLLLQKPPSDFRLFLWLGCGSAANRPMRSITPPLGFRAKLELLSTETEGLATAHGLDYPLRLQRPVAGPLAARSRAVSLIAVRGIERRAAQGTQDALGKRHEDKGRVRAVSRPLTTPPRAVLPWSAKPLHVLDRLATVRTGSRRAIVGFRLVDHDVLPSLPLLPCRRHLTGTSRAARS